MTAFSRRALALDALGFRRGSGAIGAKARGAVGRSCCAMARGNSTLLLCSILFLCSIQLYTYFYLLETCSYITRCAAAAALLHSYLLR